MPPETRRKKLHSRFSDRDFDESSGISKKRDGSLFFWTVGILLLIGVAIACWMGSFYIFGHPEKPFSYKVLTKLKKLDPPKRFELTGAPRGEFLRAPQVIERYGKMTPRELAHANESLLRNYLRNYKLTQDLVPYVLGTYNILDSYELTSEDFFETGVVALAQAKEAPGLLLEQIFTADKRVIPALHRTLLTGLDIDLKRENELSAIVHVEKLEDGRLKVSAISILYPSYESATSSGTFSLEPPAILNVEAGLPVITSHRQKEADEKYASFKHRAGLTGAKVEPIASGTSQNRLMRVERPIPLNPVIPIPSPTPTPLPMAARPSPTPAPQPTATPVMVAAASPTPAVAINTVSDSVWPVYAPGQMPRGRLLNVRDVLNGDTDTAKERSYLQGNFIVAGSGPEGAVLRTQGSLTEAIGFGDRSGKVRIIVKFPVGLRAPSEGSTFSRDARRPFQIWKVTHAVDGNVNIYVREVTRP